MADEIEPQLLSPGIINTRVALLDDAIAAIRDGVASTKL